MAGQVPRAVARARRHWADIVVMAGSAIVSCLLYCRFLRDPTHLYLSRSVSDQTLFEWFLSAVARSLADGRNPLFMDYENAPHGINAMGSTALFGLTIPLTPVTLLLGAHTSFVIIVVLGWVATAYAWYWFLSRHLVRSRVAAAVGAGLCAFSPAMVFHASGHPQIVVHALVPIILGLVTRLATTGRIRRYGVPIGVLTAWQVMIGEEVLFLAVLGFGLFVLVYCARRPDLARSWFRPTLLGLSLATAIALPLVAYPLWYQFAGPMHYTELTPTLSNDLLAFLLFPAQSLAGGLVAGARSAVSVPGEENSFFGLPLLLVVLGLWFWQRKRPVVHASAISAVLFAWISLGYDIRFDNHSLTAPQLWGIIPYLPLAESVVIGRYVLITVVMIAVIVAVGVDEVLAPEQDGTRQARRSRAIVASACCLAAIPLVPIPLPVARRVDIPAFFATGHWRDHIPPGGVLAAMPQPAYGRSWAMDWQIATDMGFRIMGGYFTGPVNPEQTTGKVVARYGAPPRPTDLLVLQVMFEGEAILVSEQDRAVAQADLAYWQADAVVLYPPPVPHANLVKQLLDDLLGAGTPIDDVWMWQV